MVSKKIDVIEMVVAIAGVAVGAIAGGAIGAIIVVSACFAAIGIEFKFNRGE